MWCKSVNARVLYLCAPLVFCFRFFFLFFVCAFGLCVFHSAKTANMCLIWVALCLYDWKKTHTNRLFLYFCVRLYPCHKQKLKKNIENNTNTHTHVYTYTMTNSLLSFVGKPNNIRNKVKISQVYYQCQYIVHRVIKHTFNKFLDLRHKTILIFKI